MSNFTGAIELIRNGDEKKLEKGVQLLFEDQYVLKTIKYFAYRYRRHLLPRDWEDLLIEAVYRFVIMLQNGKEPIKRPKMYFRSVCRNTCEEYMRENKKMEIAIEALIKLMKVPANQVVREKVSEVLEELGGQCKILLKLRYFEDKQIEDSHELARLLNVHAYNVKASSISAILTRCKKRFRDILGGRPNTLFED